MIGVNSNYIKGFASLERTSWRKQERLPGECRFRKKLDAVSARIRSVEWEENPEFNGIGWRSNQKLAALNMENHFVRAKENKLSWMTCMRTGLLLVASSICMLLAGTLALYPGARLDQEFERDHLRSPNSELKQYFTSDSFDKVIAYYKKLAPEAAGSTINTKSRRRMAFREKGDEKNSTTVEWSDEAGEDKSKTFILVNTSK